VLPLVLGEQLTPAHIGYVSGQAWPKCSTHAAEARVHGHGARPSRAHGRAARTAEPRTAERARAAERARVTKKAARARPWRARAVERAATAIARRGAHATRRARALGRAAEARRERGRGAARARPGRGAREAGTRGAARARPGRAGQARASGGAARLVVSGARIGCSVSLSMACSSCARGDTRDGGASSCVRGSALGLGAVALVAAAGLLALAVRHVDLHSSAVGMSPVLGSVMVSRFFLSSGVPLATMLAL